MDGFGSFSPRVIFVRVDEKEQLTTLKRELEKYVSKNLGLLGGDYKNRGFTPHITVAFRDLKKPEFFKAWEILEHENFKETFDVNGI